MSKSSAADEPVRLSSCPYPPVYSLKGMRQIRGGIAIAFPFFGKPQKPEHQALPKHGFARLREWTFDGVEMDDSEAGVRIRMGASFAFSTSSPFILLVR